MNLRWLHIAALVVVVLGWCVFAALFVFQKQPAKQKATQLARVSVIGIVIQGLAYASVWMLERPRMTVPIPNMAH